MVRELHETFDVDLRKCRRRAKLIARERSDLRLGDALDLVAKEAVREHFEKHPPHPSFRSVMEHDIATFTWHDLMWGVWDLHPDGTLERTWTEKGLPGGLTSRIVCPVLSTNVKPFLDWRGQPVLKFRTAYGSDNELRYRVSQEPHGDGVLQILTINREMRCIEGPGTVCGVIEGRYGKCCARVELGNEGPRNWRDRYARVIEDRSRKAMAAWLLEEFAFTARRPICSARDEFAWLTTTPKAKARMARFLEVDESN